jgi:hypothetical protein
MLNAGTLCAANRVLADCLLECTGWEEIRSMSRGIAVGVFGVSRF